MMQFWGIEVKNGGSVKVQPGEDKVVHLSQACLGDVKKDKANEFVRVYVHKDGQKFVIGILSLERFPQVNLDLVFEDDFELSHDWKHGSVHFAGYKADNPDSLQEEEESDDDDEELIPIDALSNGSAVAKESKASDDKANGGAKPENAGGKPKVKIVEPVKDAKNEEDDDTDGDDDEFDDDESDEDEEEEDEDMASAEGGSDDEDDSDDEDNSDEETPKKPEPSKKRAGESSSKNSGPDKKAKLSTPVTPKQKTDGKKVSGHIATPHPAKQAAKTPANAQTSDSKQTPKSGGSFACTSCNRSFGSDQALQSHSKAKHSAQ